MSAVPSPRGPHVLPPFEITARHRPVAVVGVPAVSASYAEPSGRAEAPGEAKAPLPLLAPFGAVEVDLVQGASVMLSLAGPDGVVLSASLAQGRVTLRVHTGDDGEAEVTARSRRHGRVRKGVERFALALTGTHLSALTWGAGEWTVRGRIDLQQLAAPLETRSPDWLGALTAGWQGAGVTGWRAGRFGQLGLRDIRVVTHADGTPWREDGTVLFTATSAGPGFFDTAHTSVWSLSTDSDRPPEHRADLFFTRAGDERSYGDHATHLLRDGDRWLVTTSTWSDFPADKTLRKNARLGITLATSCDDLTRGQHRLATTPLALPTRETSVGVWDPHLVRLEDGTWLVGYVSARKFFEFGPVLATGPGLTELTLRGEATDRRATEGTTIIRLGERWSVLASDGRGNPRSVRRRFGVFNLDLNEVATLRAPYPTNIPWPSLVPPDPDRPEDRWRLITFNGRPAGGGLPGYGTHGDLVVMHAADQWSSHRPGHA